MKIIAFDCINSVISKIIIIVSRNYSLGQTRPKECLFWDMITFLMLIVLILT